MKRLKQYSIKKNKSNPEQQNMKMKSGMLEVLESKESMIQKIKDKENEIE